MGADAAARTQFEGLSRTFDAPEGVNRSRRPFLVEMSAGASPDRNAEAEPGLFRRRLDLRLNWRGSRGSSRALVGRCRQSFSLTLMGLRVLGSTATC